jgi:ribonuclease P/MRP protein subunit RPP40
VIITKNLKPRAQCSKAAGRAMTVLGQIRRNFHNRDCDTFLRLYKQYVRPHLQFATPSWAPWLAGDKEVLEKVQEKAVKMVAGLKGRDYGERCAELGLETLEERRQSQHMALVHKMMSNGQGASMFEFARNDDAEVRTRHAAATHGLAVQFARTDIRKYSFAVRVVEPWNRLLPDTLKKAASKEAFKREWRQLRRGEWGS